jgi:DNA-binding beta-propeller fold protein YncE
LRSCTFTIGCWAEPEIFDVADAKEGALAAFDLARHTFTTTIPMGRDGVAKGNGSGSEGLTPTPDGRRLIVINNDRTELREIDVAADREIDRLPLLPYVLTNVKRSRLAKLAFSRNGRTLVVTSYATALAWLIDAANYRAQTMIPLAKGPMGIAFPADGRTAIVTSRQRPAHPHRSPREARAKRA